MPFLDSLDIARRVCQHVGCRMIASVDEDSKANDEITEAYDKLRRAELRRNVWRFAIRNVALRAIDTTTLLISPDAWDEDVTYLPGAIVSDDNNTIWQTLTPDNIGNEPNTTTAWDEYFGPLTVSLHDEDLTYFAGELVYMTVGNPGSYVIYMSLVNDNDEVPTTTTPYDATVTYQRDAVVSYTGLQWRSLIELNLGVTPATAPADYAAATIYAAAATAVGSDGYIYSSIAGSNVGHDPVTTSGFWTNTTVPNAWISTPTLYASNIQWLPLFASAAHLTFLYPIGAGPASQSSSRNVYRLPSGFLKDAPQDPKAGSTSYLGAPSGLMYTDWLLQGDYLVTIEAGPLVFRFVADVTDVRKMDDMFCEGFAGRIALETCEAITQSNQKMTAIGGSYARFMSEARTINAIETGPTEPPEDDFITCRL